MRVLLEDLRDIDTQNHKKTFALIEAVHKFVDDMHLLHCSTRHMPISTPIETSHLIKTILGMVPLESQYINLDTLEQIKKIITRYARFKTDPKFNAAYLQNLRIMREVVERAICVLTRQIIADVLTDMSICLDKLNEKINREKEKEYQNSPFLGIENEDYNFASSPEWHKEDKKSERLVPHSMAFKMACDARELVIRLGQCLMPEFVEERIEPLKDKSRNDKFYFFYTALASPLNSPYNQIEEYRQKWRVFKKQYEKDKLLLEPKYTSECKKILKKIGRVLAIIFSLGYLRDINYSARLFPPQKHCSRMINQAEDAMERLMPPSR